MVTVPGPLRSLFDTFPLKTYPPIPHKDTLRQNDFYFVLNGLSTEESEHRFCLGVHNVHPVTFANGVKNVPTDPFSLADSLILCFRHGLKLPSEEDNLPKSQHSIKVLSYLASGNKELPLLIDTRGNINESITSNEEFSRSVSLKYFAENTQAFLLNCLLDSWSDLWILILLADIPNTRISDYAILFHQDNEIVANKFAQDLTLLKLCEDIPNWTSFRTRYAHLFQGYSSKLKAATTMSRRAILEASASFNSKAMEVTYFDKLAEFERTLPLLMAYLETAEESSGKTIIEIKLASFVLVVSKFVLESTHIGRVLRLKYETVIKFSEEVVGRY